MYQIVDETQGVPDAVAVASAQRSPSARLSPPHSGRLEQYGRYLSPRTTRS